MKILIDTHILLWSLFDTKRLTTKYLKLLSDRSNAIFVSAISLWEISLKYALGKLELKGVTPDELMPYILKSGFEILDLEHDCVLSFHQLPKFDHKDPFDRLIIWQAIKFNFHFLSLDRKAQSYLKFGLHLIQ
jgi:PIN domain nuclease of toxin-antitoxin system